VRNILRDLTKLWKDSLHKIVDKEKLEDYIRTLRAEKFTGKVTINFFKGGVTNMNVGSEPVIWEEKTIKVG